MADLPKAELLQHANETLMALEARGRRAQVYFKSTCPQCGMRVTFNEPNVIFDEAECAWCGHVYPFTKGGYLLTTVMKRK